MSEYADNNSADAKSLASSGVALVTMFLVGVLAGFYGRPIMMGSEAAADPQIVEKVVTATPDANQEVAADGENVVVVTATPTPTPDIMKELMADARHFQGDQDAPVTMIEFSDFK